MLINSELFPRDHIYHQIPIRNKPSLRIAICDPFLFTTYTSFEYLGTRKLCMEARGSMFATISGEYVNAW